MDKLLLEDYINCIYTLVEEENNLPGELTGDQPTADTPETPQTTTLTKDQLRYILKNSKGKLMTVVYKKKNGQLRVLNTRTGVKQNITGKGLAYDPEKYGYVIAWDMQKRNYRTVNPETASKLNAMGKTYTIKENMQLKPVTFQRGPFLLQGQPAWEQWKMWLDINRRDNFVYGVLDTIKRQNYFATQKQQNVLNTWFNKKR